MMLSDEEERDDEATRKLNKIWPKPSGPSSILLCAHANLEINKAKWFVTKAVSINPTTM